MTHWSETVVTDVGNEMLNEQMAGRFITVTAAYGGTGLVDADELAKRTDLLERKQKISVIEDRTTKEGRTITLQITNADAEYELNQIGIFAKLDADRDPQAEEKLLCIMQDRQEKGAIIVPSTEDPTFVLELYCIIKISNDGRFKVDIDKTGIVSIACLERKLAEVRQEMADKTSVMGEGAPTPETVGQPGQHYFDEETGTEYVCKKVNGDGTCVWEEAGSATIQGEGAPTPETAGKPGQRYFDTATGIEYICKQVNEDGTCVWKAPLEDHNENPEAHADIRKRLTSPNILDNWYFVGGGSQQGGGQFPINQRGETEYSGGGHMIDRWHSTQKNLNITLQDDGLLLKRTTPDGNWFFSQRIINPKQYIGKTLTFSILAKGENSPPVALSYTIHTGSAKNITSKTEVGKKWQLISGTFTFPQEDVSAGLNIRLLQNDDPSNKSLLVKAAKLELGDTQTLAYLDKDGDWVLNDTPPNYALELAKCQRYQYNPFYGGKSTWVHLGLGIKTGEKVAQIEIPVPVSPRTTPTVAYFSNLYLRPASKESFIPVIDVSASSNLTSAGTIWISCEVASDLVYETYMLTARENSATLLFDMNP